MEQFPGSKGIEGGEAVDEALLSSCEGGGGGENKRMFNVCTL